jgi:hypothetical protein
MTTPITAFNGPLGVHVLTADFAGHPDFSEVFSGFAGEPHSATAEPVSWWRKRLARHPEIEEWVDKAAAGFDWAAMTAAEKSTAIAATEDVVMNLVATRAYLDKIKALVPGSRMPMEQWTIKQKRLAALYKPLELQYQRAATAIYGNAYPLDSETGQPMLPEGTEQIAALAGLPRWGGVAANENDGYSIGAALQAALSSMGGIEENYCRMLDPEDDEIPVECYAYGVYPAGTVIDAEGNVTLPAEMEQSIYGIEPATTIVIVGGLVLLTIAVVGISLGVIAIATAVAIWQLSKAMRANAETILAWAGKADDCIEAGGDPVACTEAAAAGAAAVADAANALTDAAGDVPGGTTGGITSLTKMIPILVLGGLGIAALQLFKK